MAECLNGLALLELPAVGSQIQRTETVDRRSDPVGAARLSRVA
jgi:hypothetical protein